MNFDFYRPLKGCGEAAPPYADSRMLIVCDGVRSTGRDIYFVDGELRTGAYLASRKVLQTCREYIDAHYDEFCQNMQNPENIVSGLKNYISESLNNYVKEKQLTFTAKHKFMQMLPTSLAAIVYKQHEDYVEALVISAGNSKAYVLTPDSGLQQISADDASESMDAFSKISVSPFPIAIDSALVSYYLANHIRQNRGFHINHTYYRLPAKCMLLVCSDGCYDCMRTQMHFEYHIEYCIYQCSKNGKILTGKENPLGKMLSDTYARYAPEDDCAMAGAVLGYTDESEFSTDFTNRSAHIKARFFDNYM